MRMKAGTTLLVIAEQARAMATNGAVATGNWTLAQICDHLARAVEGSLGMLAPAVGGRKRPSWMTRTVGRILILKFGVVPRGVRAPAHVLPPADVVVDSALPRLQAAVEEFERRAAEPDVTLRAHPIFGFTDAATWRRFHMVHARHHLRFMKVGAGK
jgi:hypothetical protein